MPELEKFIFLLVSGASLMFLAIIVVRFVGDYKTSRWPSTQGRVVSSKARSRERVRHGIDDEESVGTVAHVVYEYQVGEETYKGHRIRLVEPTVKTDLAGMLQRYPAGSTVTVYYNPERPRDAVLEREPLRLSLERLGCLTVFASAAVLAAVYGLTPLHGIVQRYFPRAENENVLVLTAGMGMFLFLFGLVWLRQAFAEAHWPTVIGTVVSSKVESFRTITGGGGGQDAHVTMYRPAVVYRYEIGGLPYESNRIRREKVSGAQEFAERRAARYSAGEPVRVRYNPADPADSVLETGSFGFLVLWALAGVMFAIGASVSGYFSHS